MILGPKFYQELNHLPSWKQSLFALVLAHRQYYNLVFLSQNDADLHLGTPEFRRVLEGLWQFHQDKFNHIDLQELYEVYRPFSLLEREDAGDDLSVPERLALNAAISLSQACTAVVEHCGEEARLASLSSEADLLLRAEQSGESLSEEEFRELDYVDYEAAFQVELYEILSHAARGPELIERLLGRLFIDGEAVSNLGLDPELKHERRHFLFRPVPETRSARAVKTTAKSPVKAGREQVQPYGRTAVRKSAQPRVFSSSKKPYHGR